MQTTCLIAIALLTAALGTAPIQPKPGDQPRLAFRIFYTSHHRTPSGVTAVAWDDGLVVFTLKETPGKDLLAGWIPKSKVQETLAELKSAGFFNDQQEPGLVPDGSYTTIAARGENGLVDHRWHEHLGHSGGAHAGAKPEFYKFTKMWVITRNALLFALPEHFKPIDEEPGARRRFEQVDSLSEPIKTRGNK